MIWLILLRIGSNHKLRQIGLNFTLGRFEQYRLPKSKAERERLRLKIGTDGHHLLEALYKYSTSNWLLQIPSVETLRVVWVQQYYIQSEQVYWRELAELTTE